MIEAAFRGVAAAPLLMFAERAMRFIRVFHDVGERRRRFCRQLLR